LERAPEDESLRLETPETSGGTSLIRDQAACPFRAFARHRLNLPSLQPTLMGISASERGAILHEALFRIWRQIESSDKLSALLSADEQDLVEAAVIDAMQHTESACEARGYSLRERAGSACWQLEQQVCVDLLRQWLRRERERSASFRVVEMEQNQTLRVEGLSLTLRPDRIDEFEDGRRAIIKPGHPQGPAGWGSVHRSRSYRYTACSIPQYKASLMLSYRRPTRFSSSH
jgi:ATP-dependent helicase/DNAse subunit B